jgi:hypothetical protein
VREGSALLQGLAVCGQCGRKLRTHYTGRTASAGYHCSGRTLTNGRGVYCLNVGAAQVDDAVALTVLRALEPLGVEAAIVAAERLEADHDGALEQWRLTVERASYEAQRAERRYRAVDPLCAVRKNVALGLRCCLLRQPHTNRAPHKAQLIDCAGRSSGRYPVATVCDDGQPLSHNGPRPLPSSRDLFRRRYWLYQSRRAQAMHGLY